MVAQRPCAPSGRSVPAQTVKRVKTRDIMDLKAQMAQALETAAAPTTVLPVHVPVPAPVSPKGVQTLPSVPGFHGGGMLLLGLSGLSAQCTEASGPLASLEGADKLGLGFPQVDSTIVALVKAPLVGGLD
ncbi:UNVERIFIED_CONTAM: hypothetical protein FKN15_008193 [Acipenser sinensis]